MRWVVSDKEYVGILASIITEVNPFCRFTIPQSECLVQKNKQKVAEYFALNKKKRVFLFASFPNGHLQTHTRVYVRASKSYHQTISMHKT